MSDITEEEVISKVSSIFDVKDVIINTNDIQFKIEDTDFKNKFVNLARELKIMGAKNSFCCNCHNGIN